MTQGSKVMQTFAFLYYHQENILRLKIALAVTRLL